MDTRNLGWLVILAANLTTSCGDAVAPPAEGAVSISVTPSSIATSGSCSPPFTMNLMAGTVRPSPTDAGELLTDGKNGATVSCKVKGNGTYDVSAKIAYQSSWISISGKVNKDGTGTASVSLWYQDGVGETISDPNCKVTLGIGKYMVESGALWANVHCESLKSPPSSPTVWCDGNATVVFQSCSS